jgi:homopolymeric O-antigen transport system permease protein
VTGISVPRIVVEPSRRWFHFDLSSVWRHRELLYFLTWRSVKVRYKQAAIGAGWVILQPVLTMAVFTLVFGKLAKMPSDGLPYPLFAFAALLPWTFFAAGLNRAAASMVAEAHLITKVYFPRVLVLLAGTITPLVDLVLSFVVLLGLMAWYGFAPSWRILAIPLLTLYALLTALAVALWLAPINVRYRDVAHALPFMMQIWMYGSPVAYPSSTIPASWRGLYELNPMAGIIEGFRWALLGAKGPDLRVMAVSASGVLVALFFGMVHFRRAERTFADVV